jgi:hypothetical protein
VVVSLSQRIDALVALGEHLLAPQEDAYLGALVHRTHFHNAWFTTENYHYALRAIAKAFLEREALEAWCAGYGVGDGGVVRTVGIVMAGNIPLVGFHDFLCVFVSGHRAKIKLSDKDPYVFPYLMDWMARICPAIADCVTFVERLDGFDAVIATGSSNTARYFEAYFGRYPHIIRHSRRSVAVLDGHESEDDLLALGQDMHQYYGLGCRNVSMLLLPVGYAVRNLLETLHEPFKHYILHEKYRNNYDYNTALYILNKTDYYFNGGIIALENSALSARIACVHFRYYQSINEVETYLNGVKDELQVVVSNVAIPAFEVVPFGRSQMPTLTDYADHVDTMSFLVGL